MNWKYVPKTLTDLRKIPVQLTEFDTLCLRKPFPDDNSSDFVVNLLCKPGCLNRLYTAETIMSISLVFLAFLGAIDKSVRVYFHLALNTRFSDSEYS